MQLGTENIVKMLLDKSADVNIQDNKGYTALMYATRHSTSTENIKMLLDKSADVNIQDNKGYTALMYATRHST